MSLHSAVDGGHWRAVLVDVATCQRRKTIIWRLSGVDRRVGKVERKDLSDP